MVPDIMRLNSFIFITLLIALCMGCKNYEKIAGKLRLIGPCDYNWAAESYCVITVRNSEMTCVLLGQEYFWFV